MSGLTHVYYGYGKGKTTAALGLALRAAGHGKKVVLVQFLKDAKSGELSQLALLPNVTVLRGKAAGHTFSIDMTESERESTTRIHDENLQKALRLCENGECDLLILDEAIDAYQLGMIDRALFENTVNGKPEPLELVVTGHTPEAWLTARADYVTEMVKIKHPYDAGVLGRPGIEF
ncbi:MAG: cob(I)yrinic acid a,c-diamide adenosyltransferase [Oscillospiraceae bacterium]|jgi:cob(I)alamin adenosyltransferase|nr:cob(I)yrinic acid a,c-diamide adenosyltransferase [Oscillospiraceae bacterium]